MPETPQKDKSEDPCGRCEKKVKKLELQLHREKMKVYELEKEKKEWQANKKNLKTQYEGLFEQIQLMKEK